MVKSKIYKGTGLKDAVALFRKEFAYDGVVITHVPEGFGGEPLKDELVRFGAHPRLAKDEIKVGALLGVVVEDKKSKK